MTTSFLQKLTNLAAELIKLDTIKKPSLGFHPSRPLHRHERYLNDCFLALGEIDSVVKQLNYSAIFLANFRNTPTLKKNKISRYEYMVYHIEGYLFRVTGVMDRLLLLVNIILELGLEQKECKASEILINKKGKRGKFSNDIENAIPDLLEALIKILTYINNFRDDRNTIAHSQKINYKDLRQIEGFHLALQNDITGELEKHKHLIKLKTDRKVLEYKKDFIDCTDKIVQLLIPVYELLSICFENRYELMKSNLHTKI
ncbi:Cthe_2314 family HEPN domain-containing protein [Mucilaginibacter sp.]|uniref:Cthe_2314 family HEPN domain-containing protein n=1 Tax=Mucilaginibacter sp. TaxID=1882438 RepID=UPI0025F337E0|nr:Cthe_2314 family HEPN domain-containing protein [Mucilaginibacter sp.]